MNHIISLIQFLIGVECSCLCVSAGISSDTDLFLEYINNCIFCNIDEESKVIKNRDWFVIYDRFPVSPGHMLIIPYRHINSLEELYNSEKESFFEILDNTKILLDSIYKPDGYNIGINLGKEAGQTIMHMHIHVIPRYKGDIENPEGGIRGVIPNKQNYR